MYVVVFWTPETNFDSEPDIYQEYDNPADAHAACVALLEAHYGEYTVDAGDGLTDYLSDGVLVGSVAEE